MKNQKNQTNKPSERRSDRDSHARRPSEREFPSKTQGRDADVENDIETPSAERSSRDSANKSRR